MRIGPYIEAPLGFALVAVNSHFKFSESILGQSLRGSDTQTSCRGGYAGGKCFVSVAPSTRILAGVEYQYVGDSRRTRVDVAQSWIWAISVFVKA